MPTNDVMEDVRNNSAEQRTSVDRHRDDDHGHPLVRYYISPCHSCCCCRRDSSVPYHNWNRRLSLSPKSVLRTRDQLLNSASSHETSRFRRVRTRFWPHMSPWIWVKIFAAGRPRRTCRDDANSAEPCPVGLYFLVSATKNYDAEGCPSHLALYWR